MNYVEAFSLGDNAATIAKDTKRIGCGRTREDLMTVVKRDTEKTFERWFVVSYAKIMKNCVSFPVENFALISDLDDEEDEETMGLPKLEKKGGGCEINNEDFALEDSVWGDDDAWRGGRNKYLISSMPIMSELGEGRCVFTRESLFRRFGIVVGLTFRGKCCSCNGDVAKQRGVKEDESSKLYRKAAVRCSTCGGISCAECSVQNYDADYSTFDCKKCKRKAE